MRNVAIYAENIARALADADPAHAAAYRLRLRNYQAELEALDRHVRDELAAIPQAKRRLITTHAAFAYYGKAYGVAFLAPEGLKYRRRAVGQGDCRIDPPDPPRGDQGLVSRKHRRIRGSSRSSPAKPARSLGPPLYSDVLSRPNGPAPTDPRMIQYNTDALKAGMLKN